MSFPLYIYNDFYVIVLIEMIISILFTIIFICLVSNFIYTEYYINKTDNKYITL